MNRGISLGGVSVEVKVVDILSADGGLMLIVGDAEGNYGRATVPLEVLTSSLPKIVIEGESVKTGGRVHVAVERIKFPSRDAVAGPSATLDAERG